MAMPSSGAAAADASRDAKQNGGDDHVWEESANQWDLSSTVEPTDRSSLPFFISEATENAVASCKAFNLSIID